MITEQPDRKKDFIVVLNYAYKYGRYNPETNKKQAYLEFGKFADEKLSQDAPNGLRGVWWDEVNQFVEPGIIDWSWTKNL